MVDLLIGRSYFNLMKYQIIEEEGLVKLMELVMLVMPFSVKIVFTFTY